MGPVRQNPIQRTVSLFICVCIVLCTIIAHNIAQNRPDSFPPYPRDNHHCSDDVYLREGGYKAKRVKTRRLQEWVGHFEPKFQGKGVIPGEYFLVSTKLDTFCYPVLQTAPCYVPSFWHNTGVWRTDRQTDGIAVANTALAMRALRAL